MESDPTATILPPDHPFDDGKPAHEGAADSVHGRPVREVIGGGPIHYGEAVQFEFEFVDGSREKFHAAAHDFPKIVSNLRGYARIAEQGRRASASKPIEVVNPYHATEARTDTVGPLVVVRFTTTDGIPLLVAMEASLCAKLQRDLERELIQPPNR
jgi:hypothetical protein